ncbi:TonB-dependent receptor [Prosthecobacter sp.]
MQQRNTTHSSRDKRSTLETLSVTSLVCAAGSLAAQTPAAPAAEKKTAQNPSDLKEVVVEADAEIYKVDKLQSPKFTEPLRDIPQTITVIPKALIQDRGAFSLRDVLRNTPGISMQAGEGATGGAAGDLLTIRGSAAGTDWFLDGVRDYGFYNRDPYNIEAVEVTKGPYSANNGRGISGGAINLVSKMAHLGRDNLSTFTYGTDDLYRTTVDVNEQLGQHTALRLNGLYHSADTPGRDEVNQERWGITGSLAFGLGTDTRFFLNYQHLDENNVPDFGLPFVANGAAGVGNPGSTPPVNFDNFYGVRGMDYEDVASDIFSAIFEHDFSDKVRLRNITRYGRNHRESITSAPRFVGATTTIQRNLQLYRLTHEAIVNQTNLNVDFNTGSLEHALVTGLELSSERQLSFQGASANFSRTSLYDPGQTVAGGTNASVPDLGDAEAHMDTIAFYAFDTVKIGRFFEINGGVRYDHIEADGRSYGGNPAASNSDDLFSWKAGLVFKPVENGSIYFGYGNSQKAALDAASLFSLGVPAAPAGVGGPFNIGRLDPEETQAFELGTKWDFLKERLSVTAAIFHTDKNNALIRDPVTGNVEGVGGKQYVDGVEIGLAGQITDNWQVFAGYSWLTGRVTENDSRPNGKLANLPESSGNLWTTYTLLDKKLQLGLGVQYMDDVHLGRTNSVVNPASTTFAPAYLIFDAMVSYQFTPNFGLRLNIYNLGDDRYVDRTGGTVNQFVPGPGRSVALTASVKF